jgi:hypothetical protein
MEFLGTLSKKHAWTFTALGLGTVLSLGGFLYIYSEYAIRHAFRKYTAVDDLSVLGRERRGAKLKGAVVIAGGRYRGRVIYEDILIQYPSTSIAGLYTALACVPQFEDVVIIEPDDGATENCLVETRVGRHGLSVHTSTRKRVMQTFGFHGTYACVRTDQPTSLGDDMSLHRSLPTIYATGFKKVVPGFRLPRPRIGRYDQAFRYKCMPLWPRIR